MNRYEREKQYVEEIAEVIKFLADRIRPIAAVVGKPSLVGEDGREHFVYENPDARTITVLMLVRIVSGLRAALILIWQGNGIEGACMLRCIDEFTGNILFVKEALETGKPTSEQQKYIDDYFVDRYQTLEEKLQQPIPSGHLVRKQKRRASEGRQLSPDDPHAVIKMSEVIDSTFDGYVHGSYSSAMELYNGGGSREGFRVGGMPERLPEWRKTLAQYVHRTTNMMGIVALGLGLRQTADELVKKREEFEATAAYRRTATDATDAASLNAEDTGFSC